MVTKYFFQFKPVCPFLKKFLVDFLPPSRPRCTIPYYLLSTIRQAHSISVKGLSAYTRLLSIYSHCHASLLKSQSTL
eukprot:snap_masked-scaffold_18-processed-gene-3.27-mRNA-1 protein AED:1.00 eAED:1.00 QI:0/0/0/0/1/1/3/0/76